MQTLTQRVIKATSPKGNETSSYNLIDLRHRFEAYANDVRVNCRKMIDEARQQCDAIRKQAHEQGRAAGLEQGMAEAEAEIQKRADKLAMAKTATVLQSATPAVQKAAAALDEQRFLWLSRWETAAVEMAIALAEKLTSRMIDRDATIVRDRALMALQLAGGSSEALLHMNPIDVEAIGDEVAALTAGSTFEVVADDRVTPGDCLLTSPDGEVDGRLATQIDRIVEELLGTDYADSSRTEDGDRLP